MEADDRLIGSFYEAAANPALWPYALKGLAKLTQCTGAHLVMIDTHRGTAQGAFLGSEELAPDLLQRYLENWARIDPLLAITAAQKSNTLMLCSDYLTEKAISRSAFHQDFVIPNGTKYQASWTLHNEAGLAIALTLHSSKSPFDRSRLVRLSGFADHARQAARISVRLAAEMDRSRWLRQALDATNGLCVMVDAEGRVVDQSAAAEGLLAGGQWLRVDAQHRLQLRAPQQSLKLRELIARCTRGSAGGVLHLAHGVAEYPLVEVIPAGHNRDNPFNSGHGCSALVFLRLPRIRRAPNAASLELSLKCTRAEAEVAAALAAGLSPQEIAIRRNVSVLTIRTQIRSLRALTNTPRMSALIALINTLS